VLAGSVFIPLHRGVKAGEDHRRFGGERELGFPCHILKATSGQPLKADSIGHRCS